MNACFNCRLPVCGCGLGTKQQTEHDKIFAVPGPVAMKKLQIRVAGGEHRGKTRDLFLAAALFTRLFKMPVTAHDLERAFAVDFLLQSPQRTIHWFAFF